MVLNKTTEVGALFLLGKDRRILIPVPDSSKNKAPASVPSEFFFQIDQDQAYVQTSPSIIVFYIATIDDVTDNCNSNNDHQSIQGFMNR